jgi:hypothetical protein
VNGFVSPGVLIFLEPLARDPQISSCPPSLRTMGTSPTELTVSLQALRGSVVNRLTLSFPFDLLRPGDWLKSVVNVYTFCVFDVLP